VVKQAIRIADNLLASATIRASSFRAKYVLMTSSKSL